MNFEQIVNKAINFTEKSGHTFVKLVGADKISGTWVVKVDVGVVKENIKTVKIDDKGVIVGFK